jgi:signal transduction histidine kinase
MTQSHASMRSLDIEPPNHVAASLAREVVGEGIWEIQRRRRKAPGPNRLIDQLLGFSRDDSGELVLQRDRVLLAEICEDAIDEAVPAHPGQRIEFERWDDAPGDWDRDRLMQVVRNLLSNALRHGLPAEPVLVSVFSFGEGAVVVVANRGEPIPEAFRRILFDPPDREPWPSDHLGLYIVREVVRAHGGRIELTGDEGATVVRVWLPRRYSLVM